ncbi:uncharacterized protein LOC122394647 [Amphibalanus amphitrite]|uniref:uncharacterized protein LOC122394647 n=1 Tax=Amphibalanus amphitrite TaxID=1232801 RepID=UPI001C915A45|nr:uncharacterized protein LOC122394647 [Amphibalanus amphitrite]
MLFRVVVMVAVFQTAVTEEPVDLTRVSRGALYIRLPAPYSSNMSQCLDPQLNQMYDEGDFWSSPFSDCKLNTCVDINGVLNVERYSCPTVDASLLKKEGYFCRYAFGDRNKAFPHCCPNIRCKHIVNGKMMPLPEQMYPKMQPES